MPDKTDFLFAGQNTQHLNGSAETLTNWKILSVDDSSNFQAAIAHNLFGLKFQNRKIELLIASSAAEAANLLAKNNDISLILLDVVMEDDDAGLRLVETIRNVIGNHLVRIVILTGQAGLAPRAEVVENYDINEYWNKVDLQDKLFSIIQTNLRAYQTLVELDQAQTGLQLIVDASRSLMSTQNTQQFAEVVLQQIASLIGINARCGGIAYTTHYRTAKTAKVISAFGSFQSLNGLELPLNKPLLQAHLNDEVIELMLSSIESRQHKFTHNCTVLYFKPFQDIQHMENEAYVFLVQSENTLSALHIRLLGLFSDNASSGFNNLLLSNRLREMAYQDPVLHIFNHNWLLRQITLMSEADKRNSSLILFKLDNFYSRALAFGNAHVEQVLMSIYEHICPLFPMHLKIAREAIDALAVLAPKTKLPTPEQLKRLQHLDITIDGITRTISISILQLDLADVMSEDANTILYLARSTMYQARESKLHYSLYSPDILDAKRARFRLLNEIIPALKNGEIYVAYQPKVDLNDDSVTGFEALLRWQKLSGENIPPDVFIPIAETSGLIHELDRFVLDKSVNAALQLQQQGYHLPIAVNASRFDLQHPLYIEDLLTIANNSELNSLIELEITESQAIRDYQTIRPLLEQLQSLGIKINIDDFGTGYSSLAHIAQMPIDAIKLDRSFIEGIENGGVNSHVTEMLPHLCERFHYKVIAEGIETDSQKATLQAMGYDIGQGYLFARPMPLPDVFDWLNHFNHDGK